jgi:hypothetical protein
MSRHEPNLSIFVGFVEPYCRINSGSCFFIAGTQANLYLSIIHKNNKI